MIPGYVHVVKSVLLEMRERRINEYPESMKKVIKLMLVDTRLVAPFTRVIFMKTNLHDLGAVTVSLEMIGQWVARIQTWSQIGAFGMPNKFPLKALESPVLPSTYDFNFLREVLRLLLTVGSRQVILKAMEFIYTQWDAFPEPELDVLRRTLLRDVFYSMVLHWDRETCRFFSVLLAVRALGARGQWTEEQRRATRGGGREGSNGGSGSNKEGEKGCANGDGEDDEGTSAGRGSGDGGGDGGGGGARGGTGSLAQGNNKRMSVVRMGTMDGPGGPEALLITRLEAAMRRVRRTALTYADARAEAIRDHPLGAPIKVGGGGEEDAMQYGPDRLDEGQELHSLAGGEARERLDELEAGDDALLLPSADHQWEGLPPVPTALLPYAAAAVRQFWGSALIVEKLQR